MEIGEALRRLDVNRAEAARARKKGEIRVILLSK
jgi:hypothetical protein